VSRSTETRKSQAMLKHLRSLSGKRRRELGGRGLIAQRSSAIRAVYVVGMDRMLAAATVQTQILAALWAITVSALDRSAAVRGITTAVVAAAEKNKMIPSALGTKMANRVQTTRFMPRRPASRFT